MMDRITIRFPEEQVEAVEQLVEDGVFANRSQAIRAALEHMTNIPADADQRPTAVQQKTTSAETTVGTNTGKTKETASDKNRSEIYQKLKEAEPQTVPSND